MTIIQVNLHYIKDCLLSVVWIASKKVYVRLSYQRWNENRPATIADVVAGDLRQGEKSRHQVPGQEKMERQTHSWNAGRQAKRRLITRRSIFSLVFLRHKHIRSPSNLQKIAEIAKIIDDFVLRNINTSFL